MGWGARRACSTAALAVVALVSACVPSSSPPASSAPASEPSAVESPEVALGAALVRSDLEVRADPAEPPFAVIQPYNAFGEIGAPVYVWSGPVRLLSDDWYRVQFSHCCSGYADSQSIFGWVEAKQAAAALLPPPAVCPETARELAEAPDQTRLECAGTNVLTLRGSLVGSIASPPPYVGEPSWLAGHAYFLLDGLPLHLPHEDRIWRLATSRAFREGAQAEVTGRFDHPEAMGCTLRPRLDGFAEISADEQHAWCRQRFVVSDIRVIGEPMWSLWPSWTPGPGQQPAGGQGWRLLGSANAQVIAIVQNAAISVALDQEEYEILWWGMGLPGAAPVVDFEREIVVRFETGVSGGCPEVVFEGIGVVEEERLVHGIFTFPHQFPPPQPSVSYGCTTDRRPHGFLVAISRALLPGEAFTVRLYRDLTCSDCDPESEELQVTLAD